MRHFPQTLHVAIIYNQHYPFLRWDSSPSLKMLWNWPDWAQKRLRRVENGSPFWMLQHGHHQLHCQGSSHHGQPRPADRALLVQRPVPGGLQTHTALKGSKNNPRGSSCPAQNTSGAVQFTAGIILQIKISCFFAFAERRRNQIKIRVATKESYNHHLSKVLLTSPGATTSLQK